MKMQIEEYESPESGYVSGRSSFTSFSHPPQITLTEIHLKHLNEQFEKLSPQDILRTSKLVFPKLYQTTAFGLTGLVTLDMLSKLHAETAGSSPVEVIFLDTLYHFKETYELVTRVKERYPEVKVHTFLPDGCNTASEFEERYGHELWERDGERYDYLAKVEPQQRSYNALGVAAVLTGRRRSQGAARGNIPIVEMDRERGVVKINPLARWSFGQVQQYIQINDVPYNALFDKGYKSIGDWHSTHPVADGDGERAGRWKGQHKTECGIHNKQSRYAMYLVELAKKQAEEEKAVVEVAETSTPEETDLVLLKTAVDASTQSPKTASMTAGQDDAKASVPLLDVVKPGRKIGFSRLLDIPTWYSRVGRRSSVIRAGRLCE
ncbi:Phosphoadenosine phosphosulfate reductase family-domain-containing protein [Xylaria sp. FL0064]|nr:Phosphoadenosine phosphosulfate reductase family-domain-containing protein [Xylaria sp. FL0064]